MIRGSLIFLAACLAGLATCDEVLDWWKPAVIYQIYPRSFKDSDGDGIGDLNGITSMVPYLKDLGVGAVWLSPIYQSPGKDFGYDISDYEKIDPIFGTMEDFDKLVANLTDAGIYLIMDMVPNHSSDEHDWFKQSLTGTGKYKDYYVWRGSDNTTLPNNWASNFDGSIWQWNDVRKQYYLHQFLSQQPDLNYNNTDVIDEIKGILKFWSDKGVHGFRMDAVSSIWEDLDFKDEPLKADCKNTSNYNCFYHIYTTEQNTTYTILKDLHEYLNELTIKSDNITRVMMTESYTTNFTIINEYYNSSDFPFNFFLISSLNEASTAKLWESVINQWYDFSKLKMSAWRNWVIGNHDQHRAATRFGKEMADTVNMILLLLKGTAVTYNGEEIGMEDSFVRPDQTKDPQGIRTGDPSRSRDPNRGPMLWNETANAGFTNGPKPWLPVQSSYWHTNIKMQQQNNRSHLNTYKRMLKLRQTWLWQNGDCEASSIDETEVLVLARSAPDNPSIILVANVGEFYETVDLLNVRPSLPRQIYVYAVSQNMDLKFGQAVNSTKIELPPKGAITFITQSLDQPLKVNSTMNIEPKKLVN